MNAAEVPSDDDQLSLAKAIEKAVQESAREAVLMHKRAGFPVVGWKDGHIVWVQPDQIEIVDDRNGSSNAS